MSNSGIFCLALLLSSTSLFSQLSDSEIRDRKSGRYKPDSSFVYALPYKAGSRYLFIQGANSKMSHRNEIAFDFKMKTGSKICAARDGVVVAVKEDSNNGGLKDEFLSEGNHIIIEHSDHSRSLYWHLDFNGVQVNEGDSVRQGQVIGVSGNTGYTAFPHLHFQVMDAAGNEVLPRFKTKRGIRYLRPGHWYR
ncbi:MAG: M23 family metallopeptidase [Chitinophagaceae bacterium]|nr:MAG: M23 family metallopeptidase [Chitinophagaceae bacterium]